MRWQVLKICRHESLLSGRKSKSVLEKARQVGVLDCYAERIHKPNAVKASGAVLVGVDRCNFKAEGAKFAVLNAQFPQVNAVLGYVLKQAGAVVLHLAGNFSDGELGNVF